MNSILEELYYGTLNPLSDAYGGIQKWIEPAAQWRKRKNTF